MHNEADERFCKSISDRDYFRQESDSEKARQILSSERWFEEVNLKDFFYVETYVGKAERGKFFRSFNLLRMVVGKKANKVVVDKKTEWLFIRGRDILKQGITEVMGSKRKGDYTLILNQHGECLGFGKILCRLDKAKDRVVIENISDIGGFLRREKQHA